MPAALVMRIECSRQGNDCATWALSTYLAVPYDVVWMHVVAMDRAKGRHGLWPATMRRVAKALGHPLRLKRKPDLEEDYGILFVEDRTMGHCAVLRNGLIFEPDTTNWPVADWLDAQKYTVAEGILIAVE